MPSINPDILKWARETAGLSFAEATKQLGLKSARGLDAVDRLKRLESGDDTPTRPMLKKMAKQYHRPLIAFYLAEPPATGERGEDFRTLPDTFDNRDHAQLDALLRNINARQSVIKAALEDDEDVTPLLFVGCMQISDGVHAIAQSITSTLEINIEEMRNQRDNTIAFNYLRTKVQQAGVFVLLIGDLGSHHSDIPLELFRGFSLADPIAPFIVMNDNDSQAAWSFTLFHELTHIWLGQTGISGNDAIRSIEKFCNNVAGEILLPSHELGELDINAETSTEITIDLIHAFARERNISDSMVAYKLYQNHSISYDGWLTLHTAFRNLWLDSRKRIKASQADSNSGPGYYTVRRHRLGNFLLDSVANLMASGDLSTSKAGFVLGVKSQNVNTLLEHSN